MTSDYSSLLLTTNQLEATPSRRQSYNGYACAHLFCAAARDKLTKFVTTMVKAQAAIPEAARSFPRLG